MHKMHKGLINPKSWAPIMRSVLIWHEFDIALECVGNAVCKRTTTKLPHLHFA